MNGQKVLNGRCSPAEMLLWDMKGEFELKLSVLSDFHGDVRIVTGTIACRTVVLVRCSQLIRNPTFSEAQIGPPSKGYM
jgi:hypothetical protein